MKEFILILFLSSLFVFLYILFNKTLTNTKLLKWIFFFYKVLRTKYNKSYKNIKQILKNSTQTCFLEEIFFILKHFHSSLWKVHFFQTKVSFTQLGEMERLSKITWNIQKCVMFCNERKFLQNFLFFALKDDFFPLILHVVCIYSWI